MLLSNPIEADMTNLHVQLAAEHLRRRRRKAHNLVEMGGAGTYSFYGHLAQAMCVKDFMAEGVRCLALEEHPEYSWVEHWPMEGHEIFDKLSGELKGGADIVCMHYYLQFVPLSFKEQTLRAVCKLMRKNGILLLAQREAKSEVDHKMVSDVMEASYLS